MLPVPARRLRYHSVPPSMSARVLPTRRVPRFCLLPYSPLTNLLAKIEPSPLNAHIPSGLPDIDPKTDGSLDHRHVPAADHSSIRCAQTQEWQTKSSRTLGVEELGQSRNVTTQRMGEIAALIHRRVSYVLRGQRLENWTGA